MNRLRDLREDRDLLQKDIAKILNMSQTGYSQYETETNDIPTEILRNNFEFLQRRNFFIFFYSLFLTLFFDD